MKLILKNNELISTNFQRHKMTILLTFIEEEERKKERKIPRIRCSKF